MPGLEGEPDAEPEAIPAELPLPLSLPEREPPAPDWRLASFLWLWRPASACCSGVPPRVPPALDCLLPDCELDDRLLDFFCFEAMIHSFPKTMRSCPDGEL